MRKSRAFAIVLCFNFGSSRTRCAAFVTEEWGNCPTMLTVDITGSLCVPVRIQVQAVKGADFIIDPKSCLP